MREYGFQNEHGSSLQHGLRFLKFPVFKYGKQVVESKEILGRVGTVTYKRRRYTDTVITMTVEFKSDSTDIFESESEKIRKWIMSTKRLSFTGMPDKHFLVKKTIISGEERKYGDIGNLSVEFTCDPSTYYNEGEFPITIMNPVNPYSWSQPIYKITGEGPCTLTVNGISVKVNVSGNAIIDTERMITYREDGTIKNTSLTGDYEALYLQSGENTITITEGYSLEIIPRWRVLI